MEPDWSAHNALGANNFTDRAGANELKGRIEAYWKNRGYDVQVILVEAPFSPAVRSARFDIRSEMVNGMPRRPRREG
jgi:hypothetical protein